MEFLYRTLAPLLGRSRGQKLISVPTEAEQIAAAAASHAEIVAAHRTKLEQLSAELELLITRHDNPHSVH